MTFKPAFAGSLRFRHGQTLHFPVAAPPGQHSASQIAQDSKKRGGPSEPITIAMGNRLFAQKDYEFRPEFFARVKDDYGAPPELLDFKTNAAGATKHINDWVAKQTRDRIRDLIPQPLDVLTRLVLTNAIYLKAPWADEFSANATKPEPFHVHGKAAVDVPTMQQRAPRNSSWARDVSIK